MEEATDKQIAFLLRKGFADGHKLSKQQAHAKIAELIGPKEPMGAPVEKVSGELKYTAKANGKEYHLSPEQARSNALACSIKHHEIVSKGGAIASEDGVLKLAEKFEQWINGQ